MNKSLIVVAVLLVLLGGGYYFYSQGMPANDEKAENVQTNQNSSEPVIEWSFEDAGEIDAMPYTKVIVAINNIRYEMGNFLGSCSEIGATGGVDGKGLLAGELTAVQCWFAGGGNEIGVFANEDGGVEVMVGELSEGEEGAGVFRGNFVIKNSINW